MHNLGKNLSSTDIEPDYPPISYQVIRRFVLSKGFENSFGFHLLKNMLQDIIQGRKTDQMTLELPFGVTQQEEEHQEVQPVGAFKNQIKEEKLQDDSSYLSDSTVLYNMNASREAMLDNTNDVSKENFFNSDSDISSGASLGSGEDAPKKKKRKKRGKNQDEVKGNGKKVDEEEKELKKLLRMTDINPNNRPGSASPVENKEVKTVLEKKEPRQKEEVSLADCLDPESEENTSIQEEQQQEEQKGEEQEETKPGNEFFFMLNSQIKKSFLLSSDESIPSSHESERRRKKKQRQKRKTKKTTDRKKNDLSEFRIPDLSEDVSDGSEKTPSKPTADERTPEEDSDGSVKCVQFVKKQETNRSDADSDSDSDIQQVYCKTENSPSKGRKNIKKILKKENLKVETKQALKMETERKKRVAERQKLYEILFPDANNSTKLVLDFDPQTKDELVVVDESLARQLKPHQKDGIRFMWNCCFESLKRLEEDSGSGCILAHCMGLGKTLQVITLVHTILTHNTGVQTVLIICPLNTIRNWMHEFKTWLKNCSQEVKPLDITPCKSHYVRVLTVKNWARNGGVLIINYDMFRALMKKDTKKVLERAFLDPGPDLVVCDEGHILKNSSSNLSKCINQIKTLRRIILTGTPLQNNLIEYYCMVQFVKPNILGTKKEFCNRFAHPINNGQFEDSTELDVKIMKRRSHVLHTMLDGFIQRFGYYVLTPFLPEKQEYVISIALTELQENLYRLFIEECNCNSRELIKDYHWLQKIWTHPWMMMMHAIKHNVEEERKNRWEKFLKAEDYERISSSGKLVLFFSIIRKCKEVGDKVLLFSQSLFSLNLIEGFLKKANADYEQGVRSEFADTWVNGLDYFRLDGSTNSETRDVYCQKFNNVDDKRFRLFLVSTRAGGLGISLVAANRVIVFDASWNPTHDVQSIFRVYRFGQNKPCFIYRFLAAATMEEKIYRRQVTKLSLAHRILDEHQIERHYTMGNLQELYTYDPIPKDKWKVPKIPKDNIFAEILTGNRDIIVGYHEHDSLLENKEEEELTEEERKAAWEDYEKEKLTPEQGVAGMLPSLPANNGKTSYGLERVVVPTLPPMANDSQMCRIVDVRTLHGVNGTADVKRLLEIGRSFGMRPSCDETLENYCKRIAQTLQMIFPAAANSDGNDRGLLNNEM